MFLTRYPVDRGGDSMLVTSLEGVYDTEDLSGVTASGRRVGEDGANGLLWVDDENGSDGECNALAVDVGGILVVNPRSLVRRTILFFLHGCAPYMSYAKAILRSLSPIMGNLSLLPLISSMSLIQPPWLSMVFADKPINLTPRLVNSGSSFANAPSSVVQTIEDQS